MLKTFKSFLPPALTVIDGQKYVCPGWHKVPMNTTLEDVHKKWKKVRPKGSVSETLNRGVVINYMVDSSKGDKQYKVTYDGTWSCECPGYGFRRSCRHIKELQKKHNL